jgi:hypothetical protein
MSARTDPMLARLKPLPLRLRIAHLAALLRCGVVIVREGSLSYPSPLRGGIGRLWRPSLRHAEAKLRLRRVKRASGWGSEEKPLTLASAALRPSPTASRGEGSTTSASINDGRAG